jgi:hypothetical protein
MASDNPFSRYNLAGLGKAISSHKNHEMRRQTVHEFDGDAGRGLGAGIQTGLTALVIRCIESVRIGSQNRPKPQSL